MQSGQSSKGPVADAPRGNWVDRFAPEALKPYARMARWDRPIGYWLLFWPCAMAVGLAGVAGAPAGLAWWHLVLFLIGAVAMRGAGCALNDIADRDIDGKVARTRLRPIPSGQISVRQAAIFMVVQALVGLAVLVQFNAFTIWLGIASLGLAAVYPFMKRVTWWPQLFLGLAFSWGALMGWAAAFGGLAAPALLLYLGCVLWTVGYDTVYALQDVEDDAMVGVRSTARLFGRHSRAMVALFYLAGLTAWVAAGLTAGAGPVFLGAALVPAAVLGWQVATLDPADPASCLKRFKANHWVGLALTLAFFLEAAVAS